MKSFEILRNQAHRLAYHLWDKGNYHVVYYAMPNGRVFFNLLNKENPYDETSQAFSPTHYKTVTYEKVLKMVSFAEQANLMIDAIIFMIESLEENKKRLNYIDKLFISQCQSDINVLKEKWNIL